MTWANVNYHQRLVAFAWGHSNEKYWIYELEISVGITHLRLQPHFQGANELKIGFEYMFTTDVIIRYTRALQLICSQHITPSHPDKMAAISQTTFSNLFSSMKIFEFRFECHWNLFWRTQLTVSLHWFRWWLGAEQATSHYLNQCWPRSLTHICDARQRWVNIAILAQIHDALGPH